ncbi:nucleotidyl transferase AbiEii/AbiGii toxin family protein [Candidatus Calescamantes bacterium]|nr:nucleotidyl transferase AbiEii/AbiGii toxin family protein [Candidatus Calescamantes bacterium]
MGKQIELMKRREREILSLVKLLSLKSQSFKNPQMVMIGGYALRGYVPFSRYTRDCDFVVEKGKEWNLDIIKRWIERELSIFSSEKRGDYGFMRAVRIIKSDKGREKVSLDFMEGKVV